LVGIARGALKQKAPPACRQGLVYQTERTVPSVSRRGPPGLRRLRRVVAERIQFSCGER